MLTGKHGLALATALTIAATATAADARPKHPAKHKAKAKRHRDRHLSLPADVAESPAFRYGALSAEACSAELERRGIAVTSEPSRGVQSAVRLTGPLHGVTFRTELNDDARKATPYELADCRLVLALDDFAAILEQHDIVEVRHYSMYRPPSERAPDDLQGTRHAGALAIDAARFITRDGTSLRVLEDFHGKHGAKTCGDGAGPRPSTATSRELRAILCDAVAQRLFNVVLTPNHNRPHRNHFHLEVTPAAKWFLID